MRRQETTVRLNHIDTHVYHDDAADDDDDDNYTSIRRGRLPAETTESDAPVSMAVVIW